MPNKASSSLSLETSTNPLQRSLGVVSIVFMVVAFAAPLGAVIANFPLIFSQSGSYAAPVYIILAAALLTLFSVGFTRMSLRIKNAGAFYTYIMNGLGRRIGLGSAAVAVASYFCFVVSVGTYFGVAASNLMAHYGNLDVPWWVMSFVGLLVVSFLGYRDIDLSAKVLAFVLAAEILVVTVLSIAVIARGGHAGVTFAPFSPTAALNGAVGLGLLFGFLGFFGFEATAVFRNEARDPDRTVPRATFAAVISIGVFYALAAWAIVLGVGTNDVVAAATADPENLVIALANKYVNPVLGTVMEILLVTSMFACILAIHNALTRYVFTLSSQGVVGMSLDKVHSRHRSPARASLVITGMSFLVLALVSLSGLNPVTQVYAWASAVASLGIIALMALTSLAVVFHFARRPDTSAGILATRVAPALSALLLIGVLVLFAVNLPLLAGSTRAAIVVIASLIGIALTGVMAAYAMRSRRSDKYHELLS